MIGPAHDYPAYGGFIAGAGNRASGNYASISGGRGNTASGVAASISGGRNNTASGGKFDVFELYNSGSTDDKRMANYEFGGAASISGGRGNTASGAYTSISSGKDNTASTEGSNPLELAISTNTTNIATNTASITANTSNADNTNITDLIASAATNTANITANTASITANTANVAVNTANITDLEGNAVLDLAPYVTVDTTSTLQGVTPPHVIFEGANIHVRSGSESTTDGMTQSSFNSYQYDANPAGLTGLGNLIIGYNESPSGLKSGERSGSHNLVVGIGHRYSGVGGLIAGRGHEVSSHFGAVIGGADNKVTIEYGAIVGGWENHVDGDALGLFSTIVGGRDNFADSVAAVVVGGEFNRAEGVYAGVFGGGNNKADNAYGAIVGGRYNETASGSYGTVTGGRYNRTQSDYSTISGGGGIASRCHPLSSEPCMKISPSHGSSKPVTDSLSGSLQHPSRQIILVTPRWPAHPLHASTLSGWAQALSQQVTPCA